jgi:Family of unknown function (DUF6088)
MKIAEKVENRIKGMKDGSVFKYQQLHINGGEYGAATKAIERLIQKGVIKRASKGTFFKPIKSQFGDLKPDERELIKPFLFKNGKRVAYITGTELYNRMGLTTQVPKTIKIASSSKRITANLGKIKIGSSKSYVEVNKDNYYFLELLDALKDFKKIPDFDLQSGFLVIQEKIKRLKPEEMNRLVKYALKYPPRVRAFLGAILEDLSKAAHLRELKESLHPLTKYSTGINFKLLPSGPEWSIA